MRNCDGIRGQGQVDLPFAPGVKMCPRAAIPSDVWEDVAIWGAWKLTGSVPFAGTLAQQPVWVREVIDAAELGTRGPVDLELPEPSPDAEPVVVPEGLGVLSETLQAYFGARKLDTPPESGTPSTRG